MFCIKGHGSFKMKKGVKSYTSYVLGKNGTDQGLSFKMIKKNYVMKTLLTLRQY